MRPVHVLAAFLCVAALLKAISLTDLPASSATWGGWLLVTAEVTFAAWIASGIRAQAAWRASCVLLTGFVLWNVASVVRGASDCGCFGVVRVDPAFTLALDAALLIALLAGPKTKGKCPMDPSIPPKARRVCPATAVTIAVIAFLAISAFAFARTESFRSLSSTLRGDVLYADRGVYALNGDGTPQQFHLDNRSGRPVQIIGYNATCSCVKLDGLPLIIAAESSAVISASARSTIPVNVEVVLLTDSSQQPRFTIPVIVSAFR